MKTSELSGELLDYWVAEVEGMLRMASGTVEDKLGGYSPSTKWAHGGPLMQKHYVQMMWSGAKWYQPDMWHGEDAGQIVSGDTPLQAICRAVVRAKFGDEVADV